MSRRPLRDTVPVKDSRASDQNFRKVKDYTDRLNTYLATEETALDAAEADIDALQLGIWTEAAMVDADTSPSVTGVRALNDTLWTGAATITTFDDGTAGQRIFLRITTSYVTIASGLIHTGLTMPCLSGDWLEFYYTGSAWIQVGGNVGMGTTHVSVDPSNSVGGLPARTVTTMTDVDLSGDGVRKGAIMVNLRCVIGSSNLVVALYARKNGSSDVPNGTIIAYANTVGLYSIADAVVYVDEDAICEMSWSVSHTDLGATEVLVTEYVI